MCLFLLKYDVIAIPIIFVLAVVIVVMQIPLLLWYKCFLEKYVPANLEKSKYKWLEKDIV